MRKTIRPIAEQTSIPGTLTSDVWKSYLHECHCYDEEREDETIDE